MAQVHMTEAELARDLHAVLEKVRQGTEVLIEQDSTPVALLRPPAVTRRKLSEIAALLPKDSTATMDADFAADVQKGIDAHREPLPTTNWD